MGRGSYKRTRSNKYGFPVSYCTRQKKHFGFQTGDLVIAETYKGIHKGIHKGYVAIRTSGKFSVNTQKGTFDVIHKIVNFTVF